jgi:UDP-glucuronate decarboxylase
LDVLVAGGAGFIGSHLCARLLNDGHRVVCVDNLLTGSKRNIQDLLANENFTFQCQDITSYFAFKADAVFHLASPASPVGYWEHPFETIRVNTDGTMLLLQECQRNNARFLMASTSEAYGNPLVHPQTEEYWGNVNPIGFRSCYDEAKRCAEALFFDYRRQHNMPIKVVRIFNTHGPRMHPNDGRVVSNFIVQALKGEDITIYGDGDQSRSFCYVDDLVEAMLRMMETPPEATGPINIGNPNEFTILELAELVIAATATKSKITFAPLPSDDPRQRQPDISKAKAVLGWGRSCVTVRHEGPPGETLLDVDERAANFAEYLRQYGPPEASEAPCAPWVGFGPRVEIDSRSQRALALDRPPTEARHDSRRVGRGLPRYSELA